MTPDEITQRKAAIFETMANLIEGDPEWFSDGSVEDADLVEALRIAAKSMRAGLKN